MCNTCKVIEDEFHLLCDCFKHQYLRAKLYLDWCFISSKEMFINIMTNTDDKVIKSVGVFLSLCNVS